MNIFKDKRGKIVIGQWPNRYLWLAIVFYLVQFVPLQYAKLISFWGVTLSLLYWSYLEIVSGVNVWRRVLGIIVAIAQSIKLFKYLNLI